MNRFVKILFIIVCITFLTTSVYLYFLKETERTMRLQLERRLSSIELEKERLQEELRSIQDLKGQLEEKIADIQKTTQTYEASMAELKDARDSLAGELDSRKAMIDELNNELDSLRTERQNLSAQLSKSQQEASSIKEQLGIVRKEKQALEEKYKQLQTQREVELKKIVVKPQPVLKEGHVVIVNREYDFIIVNLGQRDGLKIGMVLDVYRNDILIAKVQIEKLYEALCSANVLPEYKKQPIQEGDTVRLSSS